MFNHVVNTLYNIGIYRNKKFRGKTQKWMNKRYHAFADLCVPSVLGQEGDFKWYVICDKQTPQEDVDLLQSAGDGDPRFYVIRYPRIIDWHTRYPVMGYFIRELATLKYDFLLTTNIDSDDGISDDFFEILYDSVQYHCHAYKLPCLIEPAKEIIVNDTFTGYRIRTIKKQDASIVPSILDNNTRRHCTTSRLTYHGELQKHVTSRDLFDATALRLIHEDGQTMMKGNDVLRRRPVQPLKENAMLLFEYMRWKQFGDKQWKAIADQESHQPKGR